MSARPLDVSGVSLGAATNADEGSIVLRKRREFEEAMEQHARHLAETVEAKERRIQELSTFIERLVSDYKFNLGVIDELQNQCDESEVRTRDLENQTAMAEDAIAQHKAARTLVEAELREVHRQRDELQQRHADAVADVKRQLADVQTAYDRDATHWQAEHQATVKRMKTEFEAQLAEEKQTHAAEREAKLKSEKEARAKLEAENVALHNRVNELESLARHHAARCESLTSDLNQSRALADEDRKRLEDTHEGMLERVRHSESQRAELSRQVMEKDMELSTAEERHQSQMRIEHAKTRDRITELEMNLSTSESVARTAQASLEATRRSEAELSVRLKEVSSEWERRYNNDTTSLNERQRELETSVRQLQADVEEKGRALVVSDSEIGRITRELERTRDSLAEIEAKHRDAEHTLETTKRRLQDAESSNSELTEGLRTKEKQHSEKVAKLDEQLQRVNADAQRLSRERVAQLTKAGEEASELRKNLALSESARDELQSLVNDLRRQNLPSLVAEMREDLQKARRDVAQADQEKDALRENIRRITSELQAGAVNVEDLRARQLDEALRDLQHERSSRASVEAALEGARDELRRSEQAHRKAVRQRETRVRWSDNDDSDEENDAAADRRHSGGSRRAGSSDRRVGRGHPSTSTVVRLRHELADYRDRCEQLEEELAECEKARATAVVQMQHLTHKLSLLGRERDDLASLNSRLRHETLRLQGQLETARLNAAHRDPMPAPLAPQSSVPSRAGSVDVSVAEPPSATSTQTAPRTADASVGADPTTVAARSPSPRDYTRPWRPSGGAQRSGSTGRSSASRSRQAPSTASVLKVRGSSVRNYAMDEP